MKNKIIPIFSIVVVIALGWMYISRTDNNSDGENKTQIQNNINKGEVIALVNGEPIYRSEYDAILDFIVSNSVQNSAITDLDPTIQAEIQEQIVVSLVTEKLIAQEIAKSGIVVTQTEIDEKLNFIKSQFSSDEEYLANLTASELTESEVIEQIRLELTQQKFVEEKFGLTSITATRAEVEKFYLENVAGEENAPALEDIYSQLEMTVIQQKQEQVAKEYLDQLRAENEVEIFI